MKRRGHKKNNKMNQKERCTNSISFDLALLGSFQQFALVIGSHCVTEPAFIDCDSICPSEVLVPAKYGKMGGGSLEVLIWFNTSIINVHVNNHVITIWSREDGNRLIGLAST